MLYSIHPSGLVVQVPYTKNSELPEQPGGRRQYTASRSRRRRFFNVAACYNAQRPIKSFWTFTVPSQQINFEQSDSYFSGQFSKMLEALRLRSKRGQANGLSSFLWVAEAQSRGNIHFHLVTDCYMNVKEVNSMWTEHYLQDPSSFAVDVQKIKERRHLEAITAYFAKYMIKSHAKAGESPKSKIEPQLYNGKCMKNRIIYCKSFNYSRNFDIYNPITTPNYPDLHEFFLKKFSFRPDNSDFELKCGFINSSQALAIVKQEYEEKAKEQNRYAADRLQQV